MTFVLSWSDGTRGSQRGSFVSKHKPQFRIAETANIGTQGEEVQYRLRCRAAALAEAGNWSKQAARDACEACVMCCSSRSRAVAALNCKKSASHSLSRAASADKDGNRSAAGEESAVRVLLVKACAVQLSQSARRHAFGCPVLNRAENQSAASVRRWRTGPPTPRIIIQLRHV